jgi:hypothetical protein
MAHDPDLSNCSFFWAFSKKNYSALANPKRIAVTGSLGKLLSLITLIKILINKLKRYKHITMLLVKKPNKWKNNKPKYSNNR